MERQRSDRGDSRDRLVDAAVELVVEHFGIGIGIGRREVFAFLTPGAVAARAGMSRALIYHHWADDESADATSFEQFLTVVSERLWQLVSVPVELEAVADALPGSFSDIVAALTEYELERASGSRAALWRASLALTLQGVVQGNQVGVVVDEMAQLYQHLGDRLGVEPVPPLTFRDVAAAVLATVDGFAVSHHLLPEWGTARYAWSPAVQRESTTDDWALLSITVEGILMNMTRPLEGDWPRRPR